MWAMQNIGILKCFLWDHEMFSREPMPIFCLGKCMPCFKFIRAEFGRGLDIPVLRMQTLT